MAVTTSRSSLTPPGWLYDVANMCYKGPKGETITEMDVLKYGSINNAWIQKYGMYQTTNHTNHPGSLSSITHSSPSSVISGPSIQPATNMAFETDYGRVTLNIKTGELTLPVGMAKEDGVREFWMGFQKHFQSVDTDYEKKIKDLEYDAAEYKRLWKEAEKSAAETIANKIATKYNGRDLLMIKTKDLVNEIKGMK